MLHGIPVSPFAGRVRPQCPLTSMEHVILTYSLQFMGYTYVTTEEYSNDVILGILKSADEGSIRVHNLDKYFHCW